MNEMSDKINPHFMQLVLTFHSAAMQFMGKVISPMTSKVERNLEAAKVYIDMLVMVETKTKGNLTEDEQKLIGHTLYELRLNYVDEAKKGDTNQETKPAEETKSEINPDESQTDTI